MKTRRGGFKEPIVVVGMTELEFKDVLKKAGLPSKKRILPGAAIVFYISKNYNACGMMCDGTSVFGSVENLRDEDHREMVSKQQQISKNLNLLVLADALNRLNPQKWEDVIEYTDQPKSIYEESGKLKERWYSDFVHQHAFLKLFQRQDLLRNKTYDGQDYKPVQEFTEDDNKTIHPFQKSTSYFNVGELLSTQSSIHNLKKITSASFFIVIQSDIAATYPDTLKAKFHELMAEIRLNNKIEQIPVYWTKPNMQKRLSECLPKSNVILKGIWHRRTKCTRKIWIWT